MNETPEPAIADQYFDCNTEYRVAICRQCAHGVKPQDIIRHLTSPKSIYCISKGVAQQVLDIIENAPEWESVSNSNPVLPISVEHPIPGLTISKMVYNARCVARFCVAKAPCDYIRTRRISLPRIAIEANNDRLRSLQASRDKRKQCSGWFASEFSVAKLDHITSMFATVRIYIHVCNCKNIHYESG
ncbi:hypothetical protein PENSUB_9819 [Penicillium subrubescens]|uniref:Uncharacterized protein n=1 Tax=Penicillium subrubescens TaxID=1316194 RepID=A0A1Q5TCD5_9EURO|nr:hypothetical protein PENSUB_9819 [Penicillium subrubescens]